MAQSTWMALPSGHQYKIVDVTNNPLALADTSALEPMRHAPNGQTAIVAAVALASERQRRITSMCRINMDILFVLD